jgi:hypothetical protein
MSKLDGDSGRGWQISIFFSLCLDIFAQVSRGHSVDSYEVGDTIKQYNALMDKVQELNIERVITQKPLIDVGRCCHACTYSCNVTAYRERISPICSKREGTKLARLLQSSYKDVLFGSLTIRQGRRRNVRCGCSITGERLSMKLLARRTSSSQERNILRWLCMMLGKTK